MNAIVAVDVTSNHWGIGYQGKLLYKIKEDMNRYGAVGSMMSGSGPSVFAFFDDMLKAQKCYEKMKENYREVFLTRTI